MSRKEITMMLAGAMLALPSAGSAVTAVDAMRCEGLQLRHESRLYACIARCDQRTKRGTAQSERRAARGREALSEQSVRCEDACHSRYEIKSDRTSHEPPCVDPAGGETMTSSECHSRLLRAEAKSMLCKSRCQSRALKHEDFDLDACIDSCETRHRRSTDTILAFPGCAETETPDDSSDDREPSHDPEPTNGRVRTGG